MMHNENNRNLFKFCIFRRKRVMNVACRERFVRIPYKRQTDAFGLYLIFNRVIWEKADNKVFKRSHYQLPRLVRLCRRRRSEGAAEDNYKVTIAAMT